MSLYEKFGEFDSAEELNMSAEGLLKEGDTESLIALAKENGIDKEDAKDYIDGCMDVLASPIAAALGKLEVECEELKPEQIMEDWLGYIRIQCTESEEMAAAVRRKGKSLRGCIAALLKWSFEHMKDIDKEILKEAGVTAGRVTSGTPGMATAREIIRTYYLGKLSYHGKAARTAFFVQIKKAFRGDACGIPGILPGGMPQVKRIRAEKQCVARYQRGK